MRKHKAEIGSVSHDTMRDEDLIPRFLNRIQWLDPKRITKLRKDPQWKIICSWLRNGHTLETIEQVIRDNARVSKRFGDFMGWSDYTAELFEILNEYAPPYCVFGSSEGDGSDYGFWPMRWEEIKQDTDALIVSDTSEVPKGYRGEVFHVSDHGNLTLYYCNSKGKLKEIWGIV